MMLNQDIFDRFIGSFTSKSYSDLNDDLLRKYDSNAVERVSDCHIVKV